MHGGGELELWIKKRAGVTEYQVFEDQDKLLLTGNIGEVGNFLSVYENNLDSRFTDMVELVRIK